MEEDFQEIRADRPPLPPEDPPQEPPPPPSMQVSNQNSDRLDFDYGDGGINCIPDKIESDVKGLKERMDNSTQSTCSPCNVQVGKEINLNEKSSLGTIQPPVDNFHRDSVGCNIQDNSAVPPPLPLEDPPVVPPPPPSMQVPNQNSDRLDFGYGDGGINIGIHDKLNSDVIGLKEQKDDSSQSTCSFNIQVGIKSNLNDKSSDNIQTPVDNFNQDSVRFNIPVINAVPPPLPLEDPPILPPPPPSIQESNHDSDWLDSVDGGINLSEPLHLTENAKTEVVGLQKHTDNQIYKLEPTTLQYEAPPVLSPTLQNFKLPSIDNKINPCEANIPCNMGDNKLTVKFEATQDIAVTVVDPPKLRDDFSDADAPPLKRAKLDIPSETDVTYLNTSDRIGKDVIGIKGKNRCQKESEDSLEEGEIDSQDEIEYSGENKLRQFSLNETTSQTKEISADTLQTLTQGTSPDDDEQGNGKDDGDQVRSSPGHESTADEASLVLDSNLLDPDFGEEGEECETPEFGIIDDIGSDDENVVEDSEDDMDDEIDAWLEEGVDKGFQKKPEENVDADESDSPQVRHKIILKDTSHDPFDILPEGWVMVTHNCGMPLYLHRESRVCTMARPYFLGPGSTRRHDIPASAIPCMHYARRYAEEPPSNASKADGSQTQEDGDQNTSKSKEDGSDVPMPLQSDSANQSGAIDAKNNQSVSNGANGKTSGGEVDKPHSVKVVSVEAYQKKETLSYLEVREYCERLFKFTTITLNKYKTWKARRQAQRMLRPSRPSLPSHTKLITCPIIVNRSQDKGNRKKDFILNPAGKSEVCILHEYVQHAMRLQPKYVFKELENVQTPFSATVVINRVEYGTGYASSKKVAKNEAAKATLKILIPDLAKIAAERPKELHDVSFFDEVKIEDPRVHELCNKAGQPGPFQILGECLKRNFGMGDTNCEMQMRPMKHQKSEFTMKVGKHTASVICRNKREGKQQAAQALLQKLHPYINSWGSLLRLYGTDWKTVNMMKEKDEDTKSVTALHAKRKSDQADDNILNKLKDEMTKLRMRRSAMRSSIKGKLELESLPSTSSVPHVDL